MSEMHPFMAMLLEHNSFVGAAESVEEEIMPLPEQLDFGPNSTAIVAMANTMLEQDFTVVKGLEPADYAEKFPDWQERMELRDHVLCEIFSREDDQLTIGWVHRLKLLPIKEYRYKTCRGWRKNGFPDELPPWVMNLYQAYTDALSTKAPDKVPHQVSCPECGSREVDIVVVRRIEYRAPAGVVEHEGEEKFVPLRQPEESDSHVARLVCTSCEASASMDDEEWKLPNSN